MNEEKENYKIKILESIRDRGVPVLYRGKDGYLHVITEEMLKTHGDTLKEVVHANDLFLEVMYEPDYATVENIENAFDHKYDTQANITIKQSGYVIFAFKKAVQIQSIIFMLSEEPYPSLNNRVAVLSAEDGTDEQVTITKVSDLGYLIQNDNTDLAGKRITHLVLLNYDAEDWVINVNEIIINYATEAKLVNKSGAIINPATEDTLNDLYSYLSTVIPSPFQLDANGNLKVYMENPAIAYNSTNDWLKISIENDNVGLAKDATLQSALPRNLTEISGVALTGRDWSNDFAQLQNLDTQLSAIKPGAGLISKQITVGTTEVQVDSDTTLRDEVLIKADASNIDIILIGSSGNEAYPIEPGEVVNLRKIRLSDLYVVSNTDNQKMYVITGGGWT